MLDLLAQEIFFSKRMALLASVELSKAK